MHQQGSKNNRIALYARVSTTHHGQDAEVQLRELRAYTEARGWSQVTEFVDSGYSGKSAVHDRPGLRALRDSIRRGHIDVVIVARLDRLFRSLRHFIVEVDDWTERGITFVSLKEAIDMTTAQGRLLSSILAALAEFERDLIRSRVVAGLAHARAKGKRLGRPRTHDRDAILKMRAEGASLRQIAKATGASLAVVQRAVAGVPKTPPKDAAQAPDSTEGENGF